MLMIFGILLVGVAIFIVAFGIFRDEEQFKASEALDEAKESEKKKDLGIIFRLSRPFVKRYLVPIVSGMKNKKEIRNKFKKQIANAGLTSDLTPEDFFAFKLFLILGFPIVFLAVRTFLEEKWSLMMVPIMGIGGFYYPNIWLSSRIKSRKLEIIMGMPFVVDMLALSVEAGLDFMAAISRVLAKAPPSPLTEEFDILIKETKIGASRAEALRNLSWRVDIIQMSSFTATLIAADSVGASIGPILKTLSNEMRQKRSAEVEKAGAAAATKMLIPMIVFIVPAVFVIIAAPLFLEMLGGGKK